MLPRYNDGADRQFEEPIESCLPGAKSQRWGGLVACPWRALGGTTRLKRKSTNSWQNLRRVTPGSDMRECGTFRHVTRLMRRSTALVAMAVNAGCFRMSIKEVQPTLQGYDLGICYLNAETARFGRRWI